MLGKFVSGNNYYFIKKYFSCIAQENLDDLNWCFSLKCIYNFLARNSRLVVAATALGSLLLPHFFLTVDTTFSYACSPRQS